MPSQITIGGFDLDDISTKITQHLRRVRPKNNRSQIKNTKISQWQHPAIYRENQWLCVMRNTQVPSV
jgi:hypothetical protein